MKTNQHNFIIHQGIKWLLDVLISTTVMIVLSPILFIIADVIKLDAPGGISFLIVASLMMGSLSMYIGFAQTPVDVTIMATLWLNKREKWLVQK